LVSSSPPHSSKEAMSSTFSTLLSGPTLKIVSWLSERMSVFMVVFSASGGEELQEVSAPVGGGLQAVSAAGGGGFQAVSAPGGGGLQAVSAPPTMMMSSSLSLSMRSVAGSTWSLSGQEPFTARDRLLPTEAEESALIRQLLYMLTMLDASVQVLIKVQLVCSWVILPGTNLGKAVNVQLSYVALNL
jgi:hypothetical protein